MPPTLLPNLLLATRSALFPANARPASQPPSGNTGATPAPAPQASAQAPTSSGKSPLAVTGTATSASFPEGSRAPDPDTSDVVVKGSLGSSNSTSVAIGVGSGGDPLQAHSGPPSSPIVATTPAINPVEQTSPDVPTGPVNKNRPPTSEIAAIKRRCAASLLAVLPRRVARTFFGGPSPSSSDRTCSAATGNLSSSTISDPSPPSSLDEGGGRLRSSLQGSASGLISVGQSAEENDEDSDTDLEDLSLLEAIETDLLDLLADEYCNKHLVYSIIETVLARLLPELAERSVEDLMEDRGVTPIPGGGSK